MTAAVSFSLRDWQNFYMLMGAAGATLIGLLFIAFSIGSNLTIEQSRNGLRTYVTPTLLDYVQVVVVAGLAVMPGQTTMTFGGAVAVLALLNSGLAVKVAWRIRVVHSEDDTDGSHWLWHVWLPLLLCLLLATSAYGFFEQQRFAYYGMGIATLGLLLIGVRNTWDLVIWLSFQRKPPKI